MCHRLCKANKSILFTVMINGVFFISFIFIYLQIKAITVVKEKRKSQVLNIINIRFPHYLSLNIINISFPLLFYWEKNISSFLLKLREYVCYFSDIFGHVSGHSRCSSIAGAQIVFIILIVFLSKSKQIYFMFSKLIK